MSGEFGSRASGPHAKPGLINGREILTPEAYEAEIVRLGALYGLEMARQSVATNYLKAAGTEFTPEDDAALAEWVQANPVTAQERREQQQDRVREEIAAHRDRFELPEMILLAMSSRARALYWHCREREKRHRGTSGEFYLSGRRAARSFGSSRRRTGHDYMDLHVRAGVLELVKQGGVRGATNVDSLYRLMPADQANVETAVRVYEAHAAAQRARMDVIHPRDSHATHPVDHVPTT